MGLDSVELVMAIEEEFDIELSNEVVSTILTVRHLRDAVATELARLHRPVENPDALFEKLRDMIAKQAGIQPDRVVLDAEIVRDLRID